MSRPSIFSQIISSLKKTVFIVKQPEKFMGQDIDGNKYYEKIADPDKNLKRQRRVDPKNPDVWTVPKLPVEWMTWLQGRRETAPTEEEVQFNHMQILKTKQRAAELEELRKNEDLASDQDKASTTEALNTGAKFPVYKGLEIFPGELYDDGSRRSEKDEDSGSTKKLE